jgi:hypothetical protein
MSTSDDKFIAWGTGSYDYMAAGHGGVAFTTVGTSEPTFNIGVDVSGREFGVIGLGGPHGDWNLWPPATNYADPAGVLGASALYTGTAGISTYGAGVYGQKTFPDEDIRSIPLAHFAGVVGTGISWPGVFGWSTSYHGVEGMTYSGEAAVIGRAAQGRGVFGICGSGTFSAVEGRCGDAGPTVPNTSNIAAVVGTSNRQHGVIGTTTASVGVIGFSTNNIGVLGYTTAGPFAGYFLGNLGVTGTKAAVVPFPDGTHRALYCMESPEVWFEDFGTAKLRRGRAVVKLDADFGQVIKRGDYRVFLTPEGDCRGLYVHRKSAAGFEARELMGGKSSIAFSYRIVGRRKDVKAQRRFAKIDTRLPLPVEPPSKPTAAGLRAFVARVEREARKRTPKVAKKGRRSRGLPKYLAFSRRIVAPPRPGANTQ